MERITIASLLLLLLGVCNAQHGNVRNNPPTVMDIYKCVKKIIYLCI